MRNGRIALVVFLILAPVKLGFGQDFHLTRDGIGPINVSATIAKQGANAVLKASARNDSGQLIAFAKLCVQIVSRAKGCDYELWTTEPWRPGQELTWNPLTKRATAATSSPDDVRLIELKMISSVLSSPVSKPSTTVSSAPLSKPSTAVSSSAVSKPGTAFTAYVARRGVVLRESPNPKSLLIEGMALNQKIEVLENSGGGWAKVRTESQKIGYLRQGEFSSNTPLSR